MARKHPNRRAARAVSTLSMALRSASTAAYYAIEQNATPDVQTVEGWIDQSRRLGRHLEQLLVGAQQRNVKGGDL